MLRKLAWLVFGLLTAMVVVPFAVANRHVVPLTFDPFRLLNSSLAFELPLSLLLFVTFMLGLMLGGVVAWLTQGKWRKSARMRTREAYRWKSEADRLARERDAREGGSVGALPAPHNI